MIYLGDEIKGNIYLDDVFVKINSVTFGTHFNIMVILQIQVQIIKYWFYLILC